MHSSEQQVKKSMKISEKYRIRKYIKQFKNIVSEEHNYNIFMKIHEVTMIK